MNKLLMIISFCSLVGCASYQKGEYAHVLSGEHPDRTPITGYIDKQLTTEHYAVLHFTFGNGRKDWLRVKKVRLNLDDEKINNKANIVVGQDIATWSDSIKHKIEVDQWNKAMFLNSIALVGAVTSGVSAAKGNTQLALVAGGVSVLSTTILETNRVIDQLNDLERGTVIPRTHLYNPFSVPKGLYTRRWILLQIRKKDIPSYVIFDVDYLDGKKARYRVKLNNRV